MRRVWRHTAQRTWLKVAITFGAAALVMAGWSAYVRSWVPRGPTNGVAVLLVMPIAVILPAAAVVWFDHRRRIYWLYGAASALGVAAVQVRGELSGILFLAPLTIALWLIATYAGFMSQALSRACYEIRLGDAAHCPGCGYCLTGNVSGTCPECGQRVSV